MQASKVAFGKWRARFSGSGTVSNPLHGSWRWDCAVCLLLGLSFFLIYNANQRTIGAGDTYPARYLPLSIWKHHSLTLDPIALLVAQGREVPTGKSQSTAAFWMIKNPAGGIVSLYPVVTPVIVAPLYLPAVAYLDEMGWEPLRVDYVARVMEKLCASFLASLSAMLLYLLLRRRSSPDAAVLLTIAYALGTTTWVISSQALWMHGLAGLLVVAMLYLLTGPCTPLRALGAGLFCALLACNRQPDAILAAGFALYAIRWAGSRLIWFLAAAAVPVGLALAYNLFVVGHVIGGYGLMPSLESRVSKFGEDTLYGIAVLLFSPVYGLFVFSPFLLFVPLFLPFVLRDQGSRGLTLAAGGALVVQLLFYGATHWEQGLSWGPRYLTEALPILVWMLSPVFERLRTLGRAVFGLACLIAVVIQGVGAFCYTGKALGSAVAAKGPLITRDTWKQLVWDIGNTPFLAELKHGLIAPDFGELKGNIDVAEMRDEGGGRHLVVAGWALMDGHTPSDVTLMVDGQVVVGGTDVFFERPDVVRALGTRDPGGWQVKFPADDLAPGAHVVTALVRDRSGGQQRLLGERRFIVTQSDSRLVKAARSAVSLLVEHQSHAGYWLTEFSKETRFVPQRQELNIFINAALIDVVEPIARQAGLTGAMVRARKFLTNQIEENGLVRYHGRPDLPTMGVMGCRITPDADDTALAWRIAPNPHSALLPLALSTLKQFRTSDGLYQTWLAPREQFRCIDPGKDPNPPDIGIQLHVYLWLAQVDLPAARELCTALQKRSTDESLWVYYRLAPPIVLLRLHEVSEAGCPLQLPESRLRTTVAGQGIWLELLGHLRHFEAANDLTESRSKAITLLLSKLAAENFASLKGNPPLLYHNDLSASVSRYYWSEAFGYALWLRLYYEHEGALSAASPGAGGRVPNSENGSAKP
ncbi:hypothetical protein HNP49_002564 [Pseudomonas fluvialis]|uniref:Glycosyltransferase RgtA/B/C/D-like domain-containing protein n=1 Tax=Pseudomonas fluvialis TaxID=1793966 RepID=A0A7X0BTI6_9PSED|nr:hypothetical protein [Pseudomonas fluvialis]MBB6342382.1 hypothetical protein [Pseudomonas fluvialis]